MILHSYLTNGFFPWAKIFLESYKYHNGEDHKVILSTRDLTDIQVAELYSLYGNLQVENSSFSIEDMAKKANVSTKVLLKYKKQVEEEHVTMKNKVWKLMIAADDRVKSVYNTMKSNMDEDYMFHSDIDMYIRAPLDELFEHIKKHDITIKLRLKSKLNRKTMIGVQGYKISKTTLAFLNYWIAKVEKVSPKDRPLGYGQTACYYAYEKFKSRVVWGNIKRRFIAPQMLETDIIWSANTPNGKTENLKLCYKDFEEIKNGKKINNPV